MKKVLVVKADEIEVKPFILNDFIAAETVRTKVRKITKKELKRVAKEIGLDYSNEEIQSIKKLMEACLAKRIEV